MSWPLASIGSEIDVSRVSASQVPGFDASISAGGWLWRADVPGPANGTPQALFGQGQFSQAGAATSVSGGPRPGAPGYRFAQDISTTVSATGPLNATLWAIVQVLPGSCGLWGSTTSEGAFEFGFNASGQFGIVGGSFFGASHPLGSWAFVALTEAPRTACLSLNGTVTDVIGAITGSGTRTVWAVNARASAMGRLPSTQRFDWGANPANRLRDLAIWVLAGMPTFPRLAPRRTSAILFPGSPGAPITTERRSGTSAGTSTVTGAGRAAPAGTRSGTSTGTGTTAGSVRGVGRISGPSAGTSTVTGSLVFVTTLRRGGTTAGTSTATGSARGTIIARSDGLTEGFGTVAGDARSRAVYAGSSTGSSTVTASGRIVIRRAGTITSSSTLTATPAQTVQRAGVALGATTVAGMLRAAGQLTATLSGRSTVLATPVRARGLIAGTIAGVSTATAARREVVRSAGIMDGSSAANGSLQATGRATGSSTGQSVATGSALRVLRRDATIQGRGSTPTTPVRAFARLDGASNGTSTCASVEVLVFRLAGVSNGTSAATGDRSSRNGRGGAATGGSSLTGAIRATARLGGSVNGIGDVIGEVRAVARLEGGINGTGTVSTGWLSARSRGFGFATGIATSMGAARGVGRILGASVGVATGRGAARISLLAGFDADATGSIFHRGTSPRIFHGRLPTMLGVFPTETRIKSPNEIRRFGFDFSEFPELSAETLELAQIAVDSGGLACGPPSLSTTTEEGIPVGQLVWVTVAGGVVGFDYTVRVTATTTGGSQLEVRGRIAIR